MHAAIRRTAMIFDPFKLTNDRHNEAENTPENDRVELHGDESGKARDSS